LAPSADRNGAQEEALRLNASCEVPLAIQLAADIALHQSHGVATILRILAQDPGHVAVVDEGGVPGGTQEVAVRVTDPRPQTVRGLADIGGDHAGCRAEHGVGGGHVQEHAVRPASGHV
jgi:hypothetical protein